MPINNNVDLVVAYDANANVRAPRMLSPEFPPAMEHACQCIAIEVLRTLMASGMTVQEYNDLDDATWNAIILESKDRASLNVSAPVQECFEAHPGVGGNYGGNYFEHGYLSTIAGMAQGDTILFTRTGGLQ